MGEQPGQMVDGRGQQEHCATPPRQLNKEDQWTPLNAPRKEIRLPVKMRHINKHKGWGRVAEENRQRRKRQPTRTRRRKWGGREGKENPPNIRRPRQSGPSKIGGWKDGT